MSETLLDVADLRVGFPGEAGGIDAVRGVDYTVHAGEVVAIVGESGSAKSVSSLAVLGLLADQARVTGSIRFQGRELLGLGDRELSRLRGAAMSMVFQGPLSALTPVYRVGDQIAEALLVHDTAPDRRALARGRWSCSNSSASTTRRGVPLGVSARVLRWHAAAVRDRNGDRERPCAHRLRRTHHRSRRQFKRRRGEVRAIDGVSFEVRRGRTLAPVGESGSGKSTTLTQIMDLAVPESGSIEVFGNDVARLTPAQRRAVRRRVQIVFQDPTAALDPRMPVFDLLAEPLRIDGRGRAEVARRVPELLDLVGLAREHAARYPADFSGGQKQRINIARPLALDPEVLVLDEPVSSLDVSIQAGVLNLLRRLQESRGIAYLFVSHDLPVVRNLAHDVAVMYRGRIVDLGPAEEVLEHPQHQYTRALLAAVPAM
ncbi:MAG TPA: ATP-binding cassette domain-containing protein [Aldersonia sp.]